LLEIISDEKCNNPIKDLFIFAHALGQKIFKTVVIDF